MKKEKKKAKISNKVIKIILSVLILGIGIITYALLRTLFVTIDSESKRNIDQQSQLIHTSITNFMLPGQAPLAVKLLGDMENSNPNFEIELFRSNGEKAFKDNKTIQAVNKNLNFNKFAEKDLTQMDLTHTSMMDRNPNRTYITQKRQLYNLPECITCHGSDHNIRGIIQITSDVTESQNKKNNGILLSSILFPLVVLILLFVLIHFLTTNIIKPIKVIGKVCDSVTNGDFNEVVNIKNKDEIGDLGDQVNKMSKGLKERFELSKYVSESTINSLNSNDTRGVRTELTLFFSDIRGFTSFSEKNTPERIIESLNNILNFQTDIIKEFGGDIDKYVGDEIFAIFSGDNHEERACLAGLKIQKELKKNITDFNNLHIGIGIHKGEVVLGMLGSDKRADFTVIGDNVNIASRICSAAKKDEVLVSDVIYNIVTKKLNFSEPQLIDVKGKSLSLKVYNIIF